MTLQKLSDKTPFAFPGEKTRPYGLPKQVYKTQTLKNMENKGTWKTITWARKVIQQAVDQDQHKTTMQKTSKKSE